MTALFVCPLSRLEATLAKSGASHVVTLLGPEATLPPLPTILPEQRLILRFADILGPLEGYITPSEVHIATLLTFLRRWDRARPMLFHCYAGISRSTAAAFIAACALMPERMENVIARDLRLASPSATPNALMIALADNMLGCDGRMSAAVAGIGRGRDAFEGEPFRLDLQG